MNITVLKLSLLKERVAGENDCGETNQLKRGEAWKARYDHHWQRTGMKKLINFSFICFGREDLS